MEHCCLSRERVHHSSQLGDSEEEEEASMMVGNISSALFTKQPLPSYAQTHGLQSCHFYHLKPCRALNSAQPPTLQSPSKEKMAKKVTFAKDLVQIYPTSHQPISREAEEVPKVGSPKAPKKEARRSFLSCKDMRAQREGQMKKEVKEGAVSSCNNLMKEAASGVVRVKVVISKKQLSELLKSSTPSLLLRKQREML